jgi:hypothetical protein
MERETDSNPLDVRANEYAQCPVARNESILELSTSSANSRTPHRCNFQSTSYRILPPKTHEGLHEGKVTYGRENFRCRSHSGIPDQGFTKRRDWQTEVAREGVRE